MNGTDQGAYDLYVAMRKVANIIFEEIRKAQEAGARLDVSFDDDTYVNPRFDQTHQGLFLECRREVPCVVWSPWGFWKFIGHYAHSGNPWPKILEQVLKRLGATEYMPESVDNGGPFGPVYAIHKVDEIQLPEPLHRRREDRLTYNVATQMWDNMTRRYNAERTRVN